MELQVENYRGIASATVELSPQITIFAGPCGSGKSSMIEPLQSLITGEKSVDIKKPDYKILVRDDEKSGRARLTWETDGVGTIKRNEQNEVKFPSYGFAGEVKKLSSRYAAGLENPALIPPEKLSAVLNILPTKTDLILELGNLPEVDPDTVDKVWKSIEDNGWDKALRQAEDNRLVLQRDWEKLSGATWQPVNAAKWKPEHLVADKTLEDLEQDVKLCEKIVEHALKAEALNEREHDELKKLADSEPAIQIEIDASASSVAELDDKLAKARSLLSVLPAALSLEKKYTCNFCSNAGVIEGDHLVAPKTNVTSADATAAKAKYAEQSRLVTELEQKRAAAQVCYQNSKRDLERAKNAQKQLNVPVLEPAPAVKIEDAKAELELSRKQLKALKVKKECDELVWYQGISNYICDVLNPNGLRKNVLSQKVGEFNVLLEIICENAGWTFEHKKVRKPVDVKLNECLEVRAFGDRPYNALSPGQKRAVNVAFQIALAKNDGSKVLVFDEFGQLDSELAEGVINVLAELPIRSVIGVKINDKNEAPFLGSLGITYWCGGGTAEALQAVTA